MDENELRNIKNCELPIKKKKKTQTKIRLKS